MEDIEIKTSSGEPEARIAMCKCKETQGKTYGVRFQRADGGWKYTWAFKMKESSAKREGYDTTQIKGSIFPDDSYPGCPYCGVEYFVICNKCKHMNCNIKTGSTFTCAWCGMTGTLETYKGEGIESGGDRG